MTDLTASDEYGPYYREIELHWSWRRENQIIVSPIEFEQIEQWYESHVPLAVILRAIDVFIEKKKKVKIRRSYLLTHVHGTVEKVHREYVTLHTGEGDEESGLLTTKLKGLTRKLSRLNKEYPEDKPFLDGVNTELKRFTPEKTVDYDELDKILSELDRKMIDHFREKLSETEFRTLKDEVTEILTEEEDAEFFAKMVADSVRAHFGLPRLTMLG